MPKLPFMKFYVSDWVNEYELAKCSLSSRGFWLELLCAMHNLDQSGVITGTAEQISRICRCSTVEVDQCTDELRSQHVGEITNRSGVYTFVNRRMRREFESQAKASSRQEKFQNANKTQNKRKINGVDIETDIDKENISNEIQKKLIESAEQIRKNHPRIVKPIYTDKFIVELLSDHIEELDEFARNLLERTKLYAASTANWPSKDKKFIVGSFEWFSGGGYKEDPESWKRGDDANRKEFDF